MWSRSPAMRVRGAAGGSLGSGPGSIWAGGTDEKVTLAGSTAVAGPEAGLGSAGPQAPRKAKRVPAYSVFIRLPYEKVDSMVLPLGLRGRIVSGVIVPVVGAPERRAVQDRAGERDLHARQALSRRHGRPAAGPLPDDEDRQVRVPGDERGLGHLVHRRRIDEDVVIVLARPVERLFQPRHSRELRRTARPLARAQDVDPVDPGLLDSFLERAFAAQDLLQPLPFLQADQLPLRRTPEIGVENEDTPPFHGQHFGQVG